MASYPRLGENRLMLGESDEEWTSLDRLYCSVTALYTAVFRSTVCLWQRAYLGFDTGTSTYFFTSTSSISYLEKSVRNTWILPSTPGS